MNHLGAQPSNQRLNNVLKLLGDRWTLLVIYELFSGKRKFSQLQCMLGISTNILSNRLLQLAEYGIIVKIPYQERPVRYEYMLTPKGQQLDSVFLAIIKWGIMFQESKNG